jgi:hypothetical protein
LWPRPNTRGIGTRSRAQLAEAARQWLGAARRNMAIQMGWSEGRRSRLLTLSGVGSFPVVDVLKPGDVVLIKIGPRLHLDKEGWDLTRVGEAMLLANGDVGRLVLA